MRANLIALGLCIFGFEFNAGASDLEMLKKTYAWSQMACYKFKCKPGCETMKEYEDPKNSARNGWPKNWFKDVNFERYQEADLLALGPHVKTDAEYRRKNCK